MTFSPPAGAFSLFPPSRFRKKGAARNPARRPVRPQLETLEARRMWAADLVPSLDMDSRAPQLGLESEMGAVERAGSVAPQIAEIPWMKQAPTLPAPTNQMVRVSTERELLRAVRDLASNTTIMIEPGTYKLSRDLIVKNGVENVTIRGATDNRDDVILIGGGMKSAVNGRAQIGIHVSNAHDVMIANLTIRDMWHHAIQVHGENGIDGVHIYNVRMVDIRTQFLKSSTNKVVGSTNGVVEYSLFEYTTTATDNYTNGVDILKGENWIIRNNVFRNMRAPAGKGLAGPAILAWRESTNTLVEGNVLINCQYGIALGLDPREAADHIGGIVRNNVVHRTSSQSGDVGIIVNHSAGALVAHNTVILNGTYPNAIEYRFPEAEVEIVNNLVDGRILQRNNAQATLAGNITDAQPSWFIDASAGDLRLAADAPAVDAGVASDVLADIEGQSRPSGQAPDVGADELRLALMADFDQDGDADSADLTTIVLNWTGSLGTGGTAEFAQGDTDGDGDVDSLDLSNLILNWSGSLASAGDWGSNVDRAFAQPELLGSNFLA